MSLYPMIILLFLLVLTYIIINLLEAPESSLDLDGLLLDIDFSQIDIERMAGPSHYDLLDRKIYLNKDMEADEEKLVLLHEYFHYVFYKKKPGFRHLKVYISLGYRISLGFLGLGLVLYFYGKSPGLLGYLVKMSGISLLLSFSRYLLTLISEIGATFPSLSYIKKKVEGDRSFINLYLLFLFFNQMIYWALGPMVIYSLHRIFISLVYI